MAMRSSLTFALTLLLAMACASRLEAQEIQGKTRQQVIEETRQAWVDGWLPYNRHDYPFSAATIERNKERYQRLHPDVRAKSP
ncbi:DUF4148 domain-containing protein [Caballeronia glebae]|jgi:beta-lactamase class D|uniref:DUF4148 domain-containing protein n=1 Tax=Caballeronia glebae TaxID=1777143 RepID=UPI0038BC5800